MIRKIRIKLALFLFMLLLLSSSFKKIYADPYPPYWNNGTGPAIHIKPVLWPSESSWMPTTQAGWTQNDPRISDSSNGGTRPQNYVNVASSCIDRALPSIYYAYDKVNRILFFRWRVEQIANTYATGPSPGSFSSTDPWNSALWTVFIDTDGDGFREFAMHINGSSGAPATPIDVISAYYSNTPSQTLSGPGVYLLGHNPTAFIGSNNTTILNFHNSNTPDINWPNGSAETVWDYGTTRSILLSNTPQCTEYFVDYQLPLDFLDGRAYGGPKITADTPLSMFFATSNSLQDPIQKDAVYNGDFTTSTWGPLPFGDFITLNGGQFQQPIIDFGVISGCNPAYIATYIIKDAMVVNSSNQVVSTITSVVFYAYYDKNGNGIPDDSGSSWQWIANATQEGLSKWSATWNSAGLEKGQYLVGIQATDNKSINADGKTHRTFSYLTQTEVDALTGRPSDELWYANPSPEPGLQWGIFSNTCGYHPPSISKTVNPSCVNPGGFVDFTITITNSTPSDITLSSITDMLPEGFSFNSNIGGTLTPTTSPTLGATGNITWTFSPPQKINASMTGTLIFKAKSSTITGTYTNKVSAVVSGTTITSNPVEIGVGSPRLTIAKVAPTTANPGSTITYTIKYSNDSPVNVTNVIIEDTLPSGITYVNNSASNGGIYDSGTRKLTWNLGDIPSGETQATVTFQVTVDNPYPSNLPINLVNTASIDSNETEPASASATTLINAPRPNLIIQKSSNSVLVNQGSNVIFTLSYVNTGNAQATEVIITDTIPQDGFTYISNTGGGTYSAGPPKKVTWNIGTIPAGGSGSVTLTLQAANPYSATNPATNNCDIDSNETDPVTDNLTIGVITSSSSTQTCVTPISCSDTSDSSCVVTRIQTDDGIRDTYIAPAGGYNESIYQEYNFANNIVPSGSYIDSVILTFNFLEKNLDGAKLYFLDSRNNSLYGTFTNIPVAATNNTEITVTPDIKGLGVDTADKVNNLKIRFLAWYSTGANDQATDFVRVCVTTGTPPKLSLDKSVNLLNAVPGNTLTYTINFSNIGGSSTTSSIITDTLPNGVTYVSATLNGVSVSPKNTPPPYIFDIKSTTGGVGEIKPGESGTLIIVATINKPLASGINLLENNVTLQTAQTLSLTDKATTVVKRPNITIQKSSDKTLLIPGDTVTYTLTIVNSGDATANNVKVTDDFPDQTFFTYVLNSTKIDGATVSPDPVASGKIQDLNIGSIVAGGSKRVTFQMIVNSGAPSGVTTYDNLASVKSDETTLSSSNTVTVSISTNPNLAINKVYSGTPTPDGIITYTLTVTNTGFGTAYNVQVRDPIPDYTQYKLGTLKYDGVSKTDLVDGDNAQFEGSNNQVMFNIGTLAPSTSKTMEFQVVIYEKLSNGTTTISNTAHASASNASEKDASVSFNVNASPNIIIDKSGPTILPYPSAKVVFQSSNDTIIRVDNSSNLSVGNYIRVNSQIVKITVIEGNNLTVNTPVLAYVGDQIVSGITYNLFYTNSGNADATSVILEDTLPAGVTYYTCTGNCTKSGNLLTWNIGKLEPNDRGSVQVTVFPNSAGIYLNNVSIDSNETTPVTDNLTTAVGGLVVSKSTSTPLLYQTANDLEAIYTIEIKNTLLSSSNGVIVTDTLSSGFTYQSTVKISGGTRSPSNPEPIIGDQVPEWGTFSIPPNGTLTIQFKAKIATNVGAGVYQNFVNVTSTNTSVIQYDALASTTEDVKILEPYTQITPDRSGQTAPNSWIIYEHVVNNFGPATQVCFSFASTKLWDWTIYDASDNLLTSGHTHNPLSLLANSSTNIKIKYFVPSNISPNSVDKTDILLHLYESGTCKDTIYYDSVTDTTTVIDTKLKLTKLVRRCNKGTSGENPCCNTNNIDICDTWTENNSAEPCDYLEYKIAFKNLSTEPYYNLKISDIIPEHTEFVSNIYNTKTTEDILVYKPNGTTIYKDASLNTDVKIIHGTLEINLFNDINPLEAGAEGYIQYKVRVVSDVICP